MADTYFTRPGENWKAIPDFPNYEISDHGRVRSYLIKNGKGKGRSGLPQTMLKPGIDNAGYLYVNLRKDNKSYTRNVHVLVLKTFIGPCPPGMTACHNRGNKLMNHLDNLRWDTRRNNMLDKVEHGTYLSKLTESEVIHIRTNLKYLYTLSELGRMFSVKPSTISCIINKTTWKHLP